MHIAWLILKIILLTLGILLGIALILLLLLLFVPIRYQVDAQMYQEPDVKVRVSWMSFFLDLRAQYKDKTFLYYLRSFWVLLATNDESKMQSKGEGKSRKVPRSEKNRKKAGKKSGKKAQAGNDKDTETESESIPVIDTSVFPEPQFLEEDDLEAWENEDGNVWKRSVWEYIRGFFRGLELFFTLPARIVAGLYMVWSRLRRVMDNVKEALEAVLQKLKLINKKRQQVVRLWGLPTTKTAIKNCKGYILDLLKHLKPKKLDGKLTVGLQDPAATGQLFGILGLLLPLYYDNIDITADFENALVKGDIHMKGGITIFYLLCLLLKIYRDKYTMKTYERAKKILGGN